VFEEVSRGIQTPKFSLEVLGKDKKESEKLTLLNASKLQHKPSGLCPITPLLSLCFSISL
jgi:hypothetical protein